VPEPTNPALPDSFHPLVSAWFAERFGEPTPVQATAWPAIASGEHVLASAPTGSGKTLTAFLDALSRFASGSLPPEGLSVLYVSPLKALNEDVRFNLLAPLRELSAFFTAHGGSFPKIRVASRSGDTPQSERRSMASKPPAILCTTPESLSILLASRSGIAALSTVRLLILDEVHAVLGTKRGSALACAVGRLALLAGEFQRVALSATVRPFGTAARFVGASRLVRAPDGTASWEPRQVRVVAPASIKRYEFTVAWPPAPLLVRPPSAGPDDRETDEPSGRYEAIVGDLAHRIAAERSTVVFSDSRRRVERLAAMLNEKAGEGTAWAHHGSLSKDVRKAVETRLKEGRLRCVVATGTLELGIDVGAVDLVAMAGSPARADQALQRAGRSGHGVGLASRAVIYPFHGLDLLCAAAAVGAALDGDVDPVRPPRCPLDILAQNLLAMVLFDERRIDELYDEVRSFAPFEELGRQDFDAVVGLLSGKYAGASIKELAPRVYLDTERRTMKAREGTAMLLYSSGGSIPDRGYYAMRLADGGTKIGELDEEFVFERRVGNSFTFGAQAWRIVSIGDEAVTVAPLDRDADFMPFWKAGKAPRGASVARRMLEYCEEYQRDPAVFGRHLVTALGFSADAAEALSGFLSSQARAQGGAALPSATTVSVELSKDPAGKAVMTTVLLHTLRGASVNEPLSLALGAAMGERLGLRVDTLSDDNSILMAVPLVEPEDAEGALRSALSELFDSRGLGARIRESLAGSASFGADFRENAGRALLLPRSGFRKRTPLWVTRLRSKRLFEKTAPYPDFPIVAETWKSVLEGRFDLAGVSSLLAGLADGTIVLATFHPRVPTPFSRQTGWAMTNRYLYEGDSMHTGGSLRPGDAAIEKALDDPSARPAIPEDLSLAFGRKQRRELRLWAPESPEELAAWVDERVLIPLDECDCLLEACPADLAASARQALSDPGSGEGILSRLSVVRLPGASLDAVVRRERRDVLPASLARDPGPVIAEWLASTGTTPLGRLRELFGLAGEDTVATALKHVRSVVMVDPGGTSGAPGAADDGLRAACDRYAFESLLRQTRKAARPTVRTMPADALPAFIASIQHLRDRAEPERPAGAIEATAIEATRLEATRLEATRSALAILSGCPAPAALWETEILPARVPGYRPEYLDALLSAGEFLWFGTGERTVAFAPVAEYEAFAVNADSALIEPGTEPLDAWAIKDRHGLSMAALEDAMWAEAWSGAISSQTFEPVRRAAAGAYRRVAAASSPDPAPVGVPARGQRRIPLAISRRWKNGAPIPGLWFSLALGENPHHDEADSLELAQVALRAVVRRYGVVFRAVLEHELPQAMWAALFPAIRRLELSGELVAGRFFDGIDGLQFMGCDAFGLFRDGATGERLWSVNACDPASPAGLAVSGLAASQPTRLPVNRMTMLGRRPVCVSRRSFGDLDVYLAPDDPLLGPALAFLSEARRRIVSPERRIAIARINGESAARSPYAATFAAMGYDADRGSLTLW
jgi:ATP-dependent Lhr-like helicase